MAPVEPGDETGAQAPREDPEDAPQESGNGEETEEPTHGTSGQQEPNDPAVGDDGDATAAEEEPVDVEMKEEDEPKASPGSPMAVQSRPSSSPLPAQAVMGGIPDSFKSELYYLVARFLEGDPRTAAAAAALKSNLDSGSLLTPRYDWTGRAHQKTFSEVDREASASRVGGEGLLPHDHLLRLCFRLSGLGVGDREAATRTLMGRHPALDPPGRRASSSLSAGLTTHGLLALRDREFGTRAALSPAVTNRSLSVRLSRRMRRLRRTLGHLSAVYCLLFDRTGRFVVTGADDLLVKCWRVRDGRLIHTFRGASSEISDLAVSHDNRLLAAGSCDKIIRVWCLRTAAPVAVLTKHTGMITAINFCPFAPEDSTHFLASTSGDGTVSFWRYRYNEHDTAVFDDAPTRYHEKIRPGQATMLCASFSPGGTFFCVGSADHNVRVYQMNCPEGPQRILEEEAHEDRVDSIQWCNRPDQLRFVSGSKDGTARIWSFRAKRWHTVILNMKTGDNSRLSPSPSASAARAGTSVSTSSSRSNNAQGAHQGQQESNAAVGNGENEFRVTMVAWTIDDNLVVTAVSDKTLKLWDTAAGRLLKSLQGHEEEIFVLEPHPTAWNLLLSSAHDGQIMVWDLASGEYLFKHKNLVEENGQERGHAAVYDAKWSPDGLSVAASDSHGQILFVGHGSSEPYDRLPVELFFHTDYRPLLRDSFHNVVDEQTQVPPHLLPPPFLVDSEGSPYPGYIQTFVPGREKMSEREALLPGEAAALGQARDNRILLDQPIQQQQNAQQQPIGEQPLGGQPLGGQPLGQAGPSGAGRPLFGPANMPGLGAVRQPDDRLGQSSSSSSRQGSRANSQDGERPQHDPQEGSSRGNSSAAAAAPAVQRRILLDKDCECKDTKEHLSLKKIYSVIESAAHITESNKVQFDHDYARSFSNSASKSKKKQNQGGRRGGGNGGAGSRGGAARRLNNEEEEEEEENEEENAQDDEDPNDTSLDESDLSSMESTTEEEETDHSDWGSDDEAEAKSEKSSPATVTERRRAQQQQREKNDAKKKRKRDAAQRCRENMLRNPGDITEDYIPSPWLSESFPKKTPYFPQVGDVLMYFKQGHEKYLDLVKARKSYEINLREQSEWKRKKSIGDFCLVKVANIRFEIRPPRLCVLKLALLSQNLRPTGDSFSIKYHDMNDVVDFLILNDTYRAAVRRNWKNGDRIRCQIDDCWWKGTVKKVEHHDAAKRSPFLSVYVHWDNGEKEYLSPWDMEQLTEDSAEVPDGTPVTPEQLKQSLYQPTEEEWNSMGLETECRRISEALETIMSLAIAEPFNYPVDLTAYPEYMLDVEYPMDLTLVKARVDNHFYRRIDALVHDVRSIHANAAKFNRPRSDIVKNSKIIANLTVEVVRDPSKTKDDVSSIYHRLQSNFQWSDDDEDEQQGQKQADKPEADSDDDDEDQEEEEESGDETTPTSSRSRRRRSKSQSVSPPHLNPKKWKHDCNVLLNDMVVNPLSVPFRQPVNEVEYPDYHRCITTPMDISTVKESLHIGDYSSPLEFHKDVLLIFKNSREYNTDKKAKIWSMTNKLEDWFEDRFRDVVHEWRKTNRALSRAKNKDKYSPRKKDFKGKGKGKGKGQSNKIKKFSRARTFSEEEDDDEEEEDETPTRRRASSSSPSKARPARSAKAKLRDSSDDDDDEDYTEKMPTPSTARSKALQYQHRLEEEDEEDPGPSTSASRSRGSRFNAPRPNMFQSAQAQANNANAAGRRISSRIPKPPIRYRDNLEEEEEEEEERLPVSRRAQRSNRQAAASSSPRNLRRVNYHSEEEDDDEDEWPIGRGGKRAAATPAASASSSALSNSRPRRQRKPLRREFYAYSDDEDEVDTRPLSAQRSPRKRREPEVPETTPRRVNAPGSSQVMAEGGRTRMASSSTDEDDVPLARKMSVKPKGASNATPEKKATPSFSSATAVPADGEAVTTNGTAAAVPSEGRTLRGTPRKRKAEESDYEEEEEEDGSDEEWDESEDDKPLSRRKASAKGNRPSPRKSQRRPVPSKKKKRSEESESDFEEDESEEEEDEEEESESEEEEEEDSLSEDDEPIARSRKGKRPPQHKAAMQPKANASKRAAQAIDSESERTSARRPSRLTNRNKPSSSSSTPSGAAASISPPSGGSGGGGGREMRRAAQKRSYFEGDEEDEADEAEDSARENRRPRRAAAAAKKSRLAESDEEEEDEEEDDGDVARGARGRKGRPNPRII